MLRFALFMLLTLHSVASTGATTDPPAEMAKWKVWILAGVPEHTCPTLAKQRTLKNALGLALLNSRLTAKARNSAKLERSLMTAG
jgi:hypothetical protein